MNAIAAGADWMLSYTRWPKKVLSH